LIQFPVMSASSWLRDHHGVVEDGAQIDGAERQQVELSRLLSFEQLWIITTWIGVRGVRREISVPGYFPAIGFFPGSGA
jgi:hypothetical protein